MTAPDSPCTRACLLDAHRRICRGCFRTWGEIAAWRDLGDAEKRTVLGWVAERRQGVAGGGVADEVHVGTPGVGTGLHDAQIGGNGQ